MERYFFFSALISTSTQNIHQNFGFSYDTMPTNEDFVEFAKAQYPNVNNVVILSVCPMSEEDYNIFWSRNKDKKQ